MTRLDQIEARMEDEIGFELDMEFVAIPAMYDRAHSQDVYDENGRLMSRYLGQDEEGLACYELVGWSLS